VLIRGKASGAGPRGGKGAGAAMRIVGDVGSELYEQTGVRADFMTHCGDHAA